MELSTPWQVQSSYGVIVRMMMFLLLSNMLIATCHAEGDEQKHEPEPVDAVLFPVFMVTLGIISFFFLTRYAPWIPYTAAMFVLGTLIGAFADISKGENLLNESITEYWLKIDSELLLVAFLPGLVFSDATGLNTHLFEVAFTQCLIFAFPMVLAGTCLTALVAYYIFDFGWSWNLCMTFGSILAATDPVAVSALLEQVGAPPRLKVHIAGESLLNDGSAMVFFTIFSELYLLELGVLGLGSDIDGPEGIKIFCQMALGGACVGIFFAVGLLGIFVLLDKRLKRDENITQVAATITMAYLCYFVADVAWGTSGVIAVVTMGVLSKSFGSPFVNDNKLMEDFWSIIEFLLNTVLFSLGGLVWGSIISNEDEEYPEREFTAKDWGYLFALYIFLTLIRFGLFIVFFPITKRLGLSSNWKELAFQSYGGLRGAVGISLAIYLDIVVKRNSSNGTNLEFVLQTNKLFGYIGGIAFLTLTINGTLAGPFLNYLGLADASDTRKRMLKTYRTNYRRKLIDSFVGLIAENRFSKVSFAVVRHHVPVLRDLKRREVVEAVRCVHSKEKLESIQEAAEISNHSNEADDFSSILTFLDKLDDNVASKSSTFLVPAKENLMSLRDSASGYRLSMKDVARGPQGMKTSDVRRLFIELLRAQYQEQQEAGELSAREFILLALSESLEWATETIDRGGPVNDWDYVFLTGYPAINIVGLCHPIFKVDTGMAKDRLDLEKCLAFIQAHTEAQKVLKQEFNDDYVLGESERLVIAESEGEVAKAEEFTQQFSQEEIELVISHKVCKILLNQQSLLIEELVEKGLVKEQEASESMEEVQENLTLIGHCSQIIHPGEEEETRNSD